MKALIGGISVAALALWLLYRALLPKPIKGLPYYADSAHRISGDQPRTKAAYEKYKEVSATRCAHCRDLNSPIIQLFLQPLAKPVVFIDDPREAEDICLRRNKEFDRSWISRDTIGIIMPHSTLVKKTTPEWRNQRRLWQDVMAPDFLRRVLAPRVHKSSLELVELWKVKAQIARGSPIDVTHDFEIAALDAIWAAIVGKELESVQRKISDLKSGVNVSRVNGVDMLQTVRFLDETILAIFNSWFPLLNRWLLKCGSKFQMYNKIRKDEIDRVVRTAVARFEQIMEKSSADTADNDVDAFGQEDTCAMDLVLRRRVLAAQKSGVPMPDPTKDEELRDELMILLWAGHDTTSNTLSWFVKYITNFPTTQSRLRAELRSAFPGPGLPTAAEIIDANIPYLDGAVEESLRLAATTGRIHRVTKVPAEILGHLVPAGTEVVMSGIMTQRPVPIAEELRSSTSQKALEKRPRGGIDGPAGDRLEDFRPERWLMRDEEGKEVFDSYALPKLAFGDGPRGCFGRRLALQELRLMIALVVMSFEFEPVPENLNSMRGVEVMFRKPEQCFVQLRDLNS